MTINNIKVSDKIWYYRYSSYDVCNIETATVLKIVTEPSYHNIEEDFYYLDNNECISDMMYNIFVSEKDAIDNYNKDIVCKINQLENNISEIEKKINKLKSELIQH